MKAVVVAHVLINLHQGIRNVTWGEANKFNSHTDKFHVIVRYKNGQDIFYFPTEELARDLFNQIRDGLK